MKLLVINNVDIDELNLSVRAWNCLRRANINTVQDIVDNYDNLTRVRNLGQKAYDEVIEKIKTHTKTVSEDKVNLTIKEAINAIKSNKPTSGYKVLCEALDMANSALEKQMPKKPEYYGDGYSEGRLVYDYAKCPVCGRDDFEYDINNWGCKCCPDCGQRLDWSDSDE